jgi:hypothetical protein
MAARTSSDMEGSGTGDGLPASRLSGQIIAAAAVNCGGIDSARDSELVAAVGRGQPAL